MVNLHHIHSELLAAQPATTILLTVKHPAKTLHLFANGVEVGTTQATADTNWQYTFGAQPVNGADGKAIVYSLSEDEVSGYNTEISEPVTADNAMVINVTNTYRTVATTAAGIATGDDSNMALNGLLSLIAGAGLVGLFMRRRLF